MDSGEITAIAAIIMSVVFVLDKVLNGLKSRGIDLPLMARQLDDLHEDLGLYQDMRIHIKNANDDRVVCRKTLSLVKELHDWHNVDDTEGRKIWYGHTQALITSMDSLSKSINKQMPVLNAIVTRLQESK